MDKNKHIFPWDWKLADGFPAKGITKHGSTVFSCFCCGGGSSMGYKLAGYDCLGGVKLDPKVAATYKANLNPKIFYNLDIRDFNKLEQLPAELYNLDILDGSPPCTTFSMAGKREKVWGKEKTFAEGQKLQRLDDLVFVYCDTIAKLHPKVCILENVAGLVKGNGKAYAKTIVDKMQGAGYRVQVFLLNAETMGVPSTRPRVFFIGLRNDYDLPRLHLSFNEPPILFRDIKDNTGRPIEGEQTLWLWQRRKHGDKTLGDIYKRELGKDCRFNEPLIYDDKVCNTITSRAFFQHFTEPLHVSDTEILKACSFPIDYKAKNVKFYCGMSVPPVMAAQIANQIYLQWLSKIKTP